MRYAIVRVDDNFCPSVLEDIDMEFVCTNKTNIRSEKHCKNCRYGDTKEQLVRKITTAQKRAIAKHKDVMTYEKMAEEIVEFLGVEE